MSTNKRLLAVFAHPDDESGFAGTLAHYAHHGIEVSLVCATRGEAGEISDPALATPSNLGTIREEELRCACKTIGISELHLMGYCDSGMDGTPENERHTAFVQANAAEVQFRLVKLIRQIQPHVLITFEPNGWYGHPDHIAAGRYASQAYQMAGDAAVFPAAGPPWQPRRLFHAAFLRRSFRRIIDFARAQGQDTSAFAALPLEEPDPLVDQITHALDVTDFMELKREAMRCHRTQFAPDNLLLAAPDEVMRLAMHLEHFIQIDPLPRPGSDQASDLFAGIVE